MQAVLEDWAGGGDMNVVISPDVDGLSTACTLAAIYPKTRIIGLYTAVHLLLLGGDADLDAARDALWLDHDISQPGIRCIGQHLVHLSESDTLPRRDPSSFNPNAWVRQSWDKSFKGKAGTSRDKYPFGTVHLFADIAGWDDRSDPEFVALMAHADGTWFNGMNYRRNVEIWQDEMFAQSDLMKEIGPGYWENESYVDAHVNLADHLINNGIAAAVSRSEKAKGLAPRLQQMTGRQSIASRPTVKDPTKYIANYLAALDVVASVVGARPSSGTTPGALVSGERKMEYPNRIPDFDRMMVDEAIFSHAFTDFRTLSYTVGIEV
jgi:hypothetical protein